jgi:hypothetical protein
MPGAGILRISALLVQRFIKTMVALIVRPGGSKPAIRVPDHSSVKLPTFPIRGFQQKVGVFA